MQSNSIQAAVEHGECVFRDGIDISGFRLGSGKSGQGRELVNQRAYGVDGIFNRGSTDPHDLERRRIGLAQTVQMTQDALRREGNGSQRVLDLMGYATGYLAPCRLPLCV